MPWQDEIQEAAITPPSGTRLRFLYEDLSGERELRGSVRRFPDANGVYVQRTGEDGRRYPMRIFISGDNYLRDARTFEAALRENGVILLEHPVYGQRDVVPLGALTRNDLLKTAANQAVFEIEFWDTIGLIYPTAQTDAASEVSQALTEFNAASAESFAEKSGLGNNATVEADFQARYENVLTATRTGLQVVAEANVDIEKRFNAIYDSINTGIETLIDDPLTLAFQTILLIQTPAAFSELIGQRLEAYGNLLNLVITQAPPGTLTNVNFQGADLFASGYISGATASVVNTRYETKSQAISAAEELLGLTDEWVSWRDLSYADSAEIDTGELYQQLQEAVALAAGFLIEISFTLKQERKITLNTNRTVIDLCAELYGAIDNATLDFFASSNDLSWDEHIEIRAPREIVYYV